MTFLTSNLKKCHWKSGKNSSRILLRICRFLLKLKWFCILFHTTQALTGWNCFCSESLSFCCKTVRIEHGNWTRWCFVAWHHAAWRSQSCARRFIETIGGDLGVSRANFLQEIQLMHQFEWKVMRTWWNNITFVNLCRIPHKLINLCRNLHKFTLEG